MTDKPAHVAMAAVRLPGKIDDIAELRLALFNVYDSKSQREMAEFGLAYAEHIIELADIERDVAVEFCLDVLAKWRDGLIRFQIPRDAAGLLHDRARDRIEFLYDAEDKRVARAQSAAFRALAQITTIAHVKRHALIAADYGIKVVNLLFPSDLEAVRRERETQLVLMKGETL